MITIKDFFSNPEKASDFQGLMKNCQKLLNDLPNGTRITSDLISFSNTYETSEKQIIDFINILAISNIWTVDLNIEDGTNGKVLVITLRE
tara:strand:- start:3535 stop:3804 length:270 start_codon:yes stop_codon:yes gene_type:complete